MTTKIQGEGDYEAARRFNRNEQDFVKHHYEPKEAAKKSNAHGVEEGEETLDREVLEYLRGQGIEFSDRCD